MLQSIPNLCGYALSGWYMVIPKFAKFRPSCRSLHQNDTGAAQRGFPKLYKNICPPVVSFFLHPPPTPPSGGGTLYFYRCSKKKNVVNFSIFQKRKSWNRGKKLRRYRELRGNCKKRWPAQLRGSISIWSSFGNFGFFGWSKIFFEIGQPKSKTQIEHAFSVESCVFDVKIEIYVKFWVDI